MPYVIGADVPDEPAGLRFRRLLQRPAILPWACPTSA
jgi:methylisocitrate lyase